MSQGVTHIETSARPDQRGFALLVLLGVMASATLAIVLAVQRFLPPLAERVPTAAANLTTVQRSAALAHRRSGSFPADLNELATATGLPALGSWRRDPFGAAQDLDYLRTTASTMIRSRGLDQSLNTADDAVATLPAERASRLRQRARLRLLRALVTRSQYRTQPAMSVEERAAMRRAMYDLALARRAWLAADTVARAALIVRRNDAAAVITELTARHGCPPLPIALTGAGGLADRIGAADSMMVDGSDQPLVGDPQLGMVAVGNDRLWGTDDDM